MRTLTSVFVALVLLPLPALAQTIAFKCDYTDKTVSHASGSLYVQKVRETRAYQIVDDAYVSAGRIRLAGRITETEIDVTAKVITPGADSVPMTLRLRVDRQTGKACAHRIGESEERRIVRHAANIAVGGDQQSRLFPAKLNDLSRPQR